MKNMRLVSRVIQGMEKARRHHRHPVGALGVLDGAQRQLLKPINHNEGKDVDEGQYLGALKRVAGLS